MVRVPSEISIEWLVGQKEMEPIANPLRALPARHVDGLIKRCAAALKSHSADFHAGRDKENALGAFECTLVLLLDVRDIYPDKRADIDAILVRFGYPVPEN